MNVSLNPALTLPERATDATLLGRTWVAGDLPGPKVVMIRGDQVIDIPRIAPTVSEFCNRVDILSDSGEIDEAPSIGSFTEILANSREPL